MRLTTSPPSCAECHEIWDPKPPGTLWATQGLLRGSFTFAFDNKHAVCPMRATCPVHHRLLDLIRVIVSEEYAHHEAAQRGLTPACCQSLPLLS